MPARRYPRPGQRLAPRTLADALQHPLPPKYRAQGGQGPMRLCDLDESAWDRFDEETCRALASEIVRIVGREARRPDAASAGESFRQSPRESPWRIWGWHRGHSTVSWRRESMNVRKDLQPHDDRRRVEFAGLWGKCLVDLLTAIEYAADHPESRRARRRKALQQDDAAGSASVPPPRLPALLRSRSARSPGSRPRHRIKNPAIQGLQLCDLDEKASEQLSDAKLAVLGRMIVARQRQQPSAGAGPVRDSASSQGNAIAGACPGK